jgi:alpha-tubulin suppressor-like RCC1 family protein
MATNFLINGSEFSDNFIPKDKFISGGLWTWGNDGFGQLGDGGGTRWTPAQLGGHTNWKELQYGSPSTVASGSIKTDGTLWMWGRNNPGNLGVGDTTNRSSPVQVPGTTWKQVSISILHTAAIKTDGTLWCWGSNSNNGRVGNGQTYTDVSTPVQTTAGGTNWKMVSCGYYHTTAIKSDGTLWSWGGGAQGQLGDGTTGSRSTPVQVGADTTWKQISGGDRLTFAIKTDGTLWGWGYGYAGGLGNGSTADRSSPTQVNGTNWKFVSSGKYNATAIKTDGTLWTWGYNTDGQLGDGTTTNKSSPVQTVAAGTNWKAVAIGGYLCMAIKTDGTLWTWGQGSTGALGDGTTNSKSSPIQTIVGGTNWKTINCSAWAGYGYAIAIRDNS